MLLCKQSLMRDCWKQSTTKQYESEGLTMTTLEVCPNESRIAEMTRLLETMAESMLALSVCIDCGVVGNGRVCELCMEGRR